MRPALGERSGGGTAARKPGSSERGTNRMGVSRLHQIARILQVPVEFFLWERPETRAPLVKAVASGDE